MNTDGTQINTGEALSDSNNPYAAPQTVSKNSTEPLDDQYYLRASFWSATVIGWLAASTLLIAFASIAGLSQLEGMKKVLVGVSLHILAALIGFEHARRRGY